MDREKLVKIVLESEEEIDLEDVRRLNNRDTPDSLFLTELNTLAGDLDWSIGSPASECFEENEIIVRHMVPEFVVKTEKNLTDNNNTLKIERIHDD